MGYIDRECNKDPKSILYDEKEDLDNKHIAGSGKCPEFEKALNAVEIRLIQINFNHYRVAQGLFSQTTGICEAAMRGSYGKK